LRAQPHALPQDDVALEAGPAEIEVITRQKAGDPNDANARWVNTLVHLGLASTLVKTGGLDEAGVLFANAEKSLLAMEKSADSLPVQFYLALAGIRGGERYVALAANPRLSASEQLSHWRKARDSLSPGVVRLKKVGESIVLAGSNKELLDEGVASLANAEAALARSPSS